MLATYFHYRWVDETVADQRPEYDKMLQANLILGVMDDNIDGKLTPPELRGQMGDMLKKYFAMIDTDKDGGFDNKEFTAAQKLMPRRQRPNNNPAAPPPVATGTPAAAQ
jgi:hypothetical protein